MDFDPLRLTPADRRRLTELSASATSPRLRNRAIIVLEAATGQSDAQIAQSRNIAVSTVKLWRCRFTEGGFDGLSDKPRPGRPSALRERTNGVARRDRSSRPAVHDESTPATNGRRPGTPRNAKMPSKDSDSTDDPGAVLAALLRAASTTISRRGFAATRVADIAAEAGVSAAAVHYYFHTRNEILVQALLWANEQPLRRIEESTATGNATHRLAAFLAGSVPSARRSRDEYLIEIDLWSHARHEPALLRAWEIYNERWTSCLRDILSDGAADGSFRPVAPTEDIAERIVSMADGLAAQHVIGAKRMPLERLRDLLLQFAAQQVGVAAEALASPAPSNVD